MTSVNSIWSVLSSPFLDNGLQLNTSLKPARLCHLTETLLNLCVGLEMAFQNSLTLSCTLLRSQLFMFPGTAFEHFSSMPFTSNFLQLATALSTFESPSRMYSLTLLCSSFKCVELFSNALTSALEEPENSKGLMALDKERMFQEVTTKSLERRGRLPRPSLPRAPKAPRTGRSAKRSTVRRETMPPQHKQFADNTGFSRISLEPGKRSLEPG
mmetsp:Transcript_56603/g.131961  ORF Transcript_56603/g.131961 Transcript_56603/m.131961 type:complete len:213 (+) Transcript_56603:1218-1856(+)